MTRQSVERRRQRYIRDDVSTRLGGLAANLARVESFSENEANGEVVDGIIEESKLFVEWVAPDADEQLWPDLVALQRTLARWHCRWRGMWADKCARGSLREEAGNWSRRVLAMSGLLE